MMKIYLVGGAVRDQLLRQPVRERDWVVVGGRPEILIQQGFKPVGKDFPVFIHPETGEEYALARTERKTAAGYHGFVFHTAPEVTLEEDLKRRDLTINAMARGEEDQLIDPFNGQKDLDNKILRHISPAFSEDPVRILRVARFASRFGDFRIAPETLELMQNIVKTGEVDALVAERVWQELKRALDEAYPWRFFESLRECGALSRIFPEIDQLYGIPNPIKWHPEEDSGAHVMLCLKRAVALNADAEVRWAVLMHDLGKTKTPRAEWPRHHGHAESGVAIVKSLCKRLRVPSSYLDLAVLVTRYHSKMHKIFEMRAETLLTLLKALDPFRRPERFEKFLLACQADKQGRLGFENEAYPQADFLRNIYQQCKKMDISAIVKNHPDCIAEKLDQARLEIIRSVLCV